MLTSEKCIEALAEIKNYSGNRNGKYRRNYRIYHDSPYGTIESIRNPAIIGFAYNGEVGQFEEADTTRRPSLNVVASCVDTLHSKISQSKVRPFFNTINGSFKDIQCVKQAQHFFDMFFDINDVHKKVADAFRDACVFDTGVIYIDEDAKKIERALPFQVYFRPAEMSYEKLSRIAYERKDFPVSALPDKIIKCFKIKSLEYVDYTVYYDTFNKTKAYFGNGSLILKEPYDRNELPFVFLHYKNPILGGTTQSVCDMLYDIQIEINVLMSKIKDASQLNPAMTFFVPEGSSIKASQINNRVGNIIQYKPNAAGGTPITTSTPAFIDDQYLATLDSLIKKAYDMVGISELSAQSKKPSGLDSGIALATMENVESDRFETQVNQVIKCYVEIAKKCINVFDPNENILPNNVNRANVSWAEVVAESDNMQIQYSAADNLSKDPSIKLQQLQMLASAGVIPSARIAQLMQLPDLELGYSLTNNAIDAVMSIIKECIENDSYDIPDFVPFALLKEEIINTQLSLRSAGTKNAVDIAKLDKLYEVVEKKDLQLKDVSTVQENIYYNIGQNAMQNVNGQNVQNNQYDPIAQTNSGDWVDGDQVEKN